MDDEQLDIILLTIAVLFVPPDPLPAIGTGQISNILRGPLSVGQAADGLMIVTSTRDQIEAQLGFNKLDVRDLSGNLEHAQKSVPIAVEGLMALLGNAQTTSYGINVVGEIPKDDVEAWIGGKFLNNEAFAGMTSPVSSNAVALKWAEEAKSINIKIESRGQSRLNVNFNASETTDTLPTADGLAQELADQHAGLLKFLSDLGE